MDKTKSERSGRRVWYCWPTLLTTTEPSGLPMISSWLRKPRWVWNAPPVSRLMVFIRPRSSVSCTRSPTRNGPGRRFPAVRRRSAALFAGEGVQDGQLAQQAGDAPVVVDYRVVRALQLREVR